MHAHEHALARAWTGMEQHGTEGRQRLLLGVALVSTGGA